MVLGFLGCCGAVKESRCMLLLVGSRPIPTSALQIPRVIRPWDRAKDLASLMKASFISEDLNMEDTRALGFGLPQLKFEVTFRV